MKSDKKIILDTIINIILKALTFIFSLIISKAMIKGYGSNINGLFSLITQVFTYIALLEAGIGNATQQLYFEAVAKENTSKLNSIFVSSKKSYLKTSYLYFIFAITISFFIPYMGKSNLNYISVLLLSILQGVSGILTFVFLSSYKNLMISSGRYKISNIFNTIAYVIIVILKILAICAKLNIIYIQIAQILGTLLEIVITIKYCKKKYEWLNNSSKDIIKLNQRKAFLVHEISGAVFSSTDIIILSLLCGLEAASIYSVYNIIYSAISAVAAVISTSMIYQIGYEFNKNHEKYYMLHDKFESMYISTVFAIVTTATVLCLDFIKIYTMGINDVNYTDAFLPILFALIQILTCGRSISNRVIGIAGHAKETQNRSIIETIINIICSVILTIKFGIYGVLLGTVIATAYRTIDVILYTNHKIIKRRNIKIFIMLIVDFILFGIFMSVFNNIKLYVNGYLGLIVPAIAIGIISLVLFGIINISIYSFHTYKGDKIKVVKN